MTDDGQEDSMRIGRFIEVLEIVPDETPDLSGDRDAQRGETGVHPPVVAPRADVAPGGRPAYSS